MEHLQNILQVSNYPVTSSLSRTSSMEKNVFPLQCSIDAAYITMQHISRCSIITMQRRCNIDAASMQHRCSSYQDASDATSMLHRCSIDAASMQHISRCSIDATLMQNRCSIYQMQHRCCIDTACYFGTLIRIIIYAAPMLHRCCIVIFAASTLRHRCCIY